MLSQVTLSAWAVWGIMGIISKIEDASRYFSIINIYK
jgi:hypothetical protein